MRTDSKRVAIQSSPFNCIWIPRGSIGTLGGFTYAVCHRLPDFPRTVSEEDCVHCPLWQDPPYTADDRDYSQAPFARH
jgi:hypothetical protein